MTKTAWVRDSQGNSVGFGILPNGETRTKEEAELLLSRINSDPDVQEFKRLFNRLQLLLPDDPILNPDGPGQC